MWWNVIGSSITTQRGKHGSAVAERISAAESSTKDMLPIPTTRARRCNSDSLSKMRASSRRPGPRLKPIGAFSVTGRNVSVPKIHIDTVPKKILRSRLPVGLISGVSLLSWRGHVAGIAGSLLLAAAIARFLAAETQADWPHLDASTTVLSLFASWLTARAKLESWLYWIVVDTVLAWLYAAQGLVFTAFLFVVYLVIAAAGFIEWSKAYRRQTAV